ncbi:MAG: hypothetical protein M9953_12560 [Thermomicrobiales bacterium]|nr:hypothetical protein [Thermomicrobiales bacterium]MCO5226162.1 hypothetical protein [Thermomicrobiales bacterium]
MAHTNVSGVFPHLTVSADAAPRRSETGIGALMPWAGKLWMVSYVAHTHTSGSGTGLFSVDKDMNIEKHAESVVGTYANRMIHAESHQLLIGPHIVDLHGEVRTIKGLVDHRLAAVMPHQEEPETKALYLTMEGLLVEVDLQTLEVTTLFNLLEELEVAPDAYSHFKAGYANDGKIFVTNNTYAERDFSTSQQDGRLAMYDGRSWEIIDHNPYVEVAGRHGPLSSAVFATGWDRASAKMMVLERGIWTTYRLPKASHTFDHMFTTEWPRIREVETERFLMDAHFMFYELAPLAYEGKIWGVRPISTHLRMIPDFCSWRGMLVLSGNQVTPIFDENNWAGEPQSNLWFGKTDDLWNFGKPAGWGGPWYRDVAEAGVPSDAYLMTGFDKKVVHFSHTADKPVTFDVEIDFTGTQEWVHYGSFETGPNGYTHHSFADGFSAHWVRVTASETCTASVQFFYT